MSREPLIGYNHNLRYRERVYHVQTEDSGVEAPNIRSHVFFNGTVLSSACTNYADLVEEPDHVDAVTELMRAQHKQLMRELLRGNLDTQIVSLLGSLEPEPEGPRVKRYCHKFSYRGRDYSIQTAYYATVVTDVFWDDVLIITVQDDCRKSVRAGSPELEKRAQEQHKHVIRRLRDGELDQRIVTLFGSVEPQEKEIARKEGGLKALLSMVQELPAEEEFDEASKTLERYHHRVQHGPRAYDLTTRIYSGDHPHVVTELHHGTTLLTSQRIEGPIRFDKLRRKGQEQHKQLLRDLRDGKLEDTIELLEQLESLEG